MDFPLLIVSMVAIASFCSLGENKRRFNSYYDVSTWPVLKKKCVTQVPSLEKAGTCEEPRQNKGAGLGDKHLLSSFQVIGGQKWRPLQYKLENGSFKNEYMHVDK